MEKRKPTDREAFEKAWLEENLSLEEMTERFSISRSTVKARIKEYGLKKTEKQRMQKIRSTMQKRYGVVFASQDPSFAEKCKKAWSKKRENGDIVQIVERRQKTCLERYGVENPFQSEVLREKGKKTIEEKYGTEFESGATIIRQKGRQTCLKKYGVENPSQIDFVRQKRKQTTLKKYGVVNFSLSGYSNETLKIVSDKNLFENFVKTFPTVTVRTISNALKISPSAALSYFRKYDLYHLIDSSKSCFEVEIANFCKNLGVLVHSTRKVISPLEIDLYSEKLRIGIEFNGDYWRSELKHEKDYHYQKSRLAEESGVFLYHIFQHEWETPSTRIKIENQLRNLFGKNERKIYARKCVIKEVPIPEKSAFLDKNHLQGDDHSSIRLGLYYQDELVSLMTFGKPRFNKRCTWELLRFCSAANTSVVGGASKLFSRFVSEHRGSIVSYSNIAKTKGGLYESLGFGLDHISKPNYVWCNSSGNVLSRYQCQMKNEVDTMTKRGYWRVYGCGNKVWIYNN